MQKRIIKFYSAVLVIAVAMAGSVQANLPDFTGLVKDIRPSVVTIKAESQARLGRPAGAAGGSGFFISSDGYILTNRHVVNGSKKVTVTLFDDREFPAEIVGEDDGTDIALLKIDAKGMPAVKIGDPDESEVGSWVLAFGAPFGLEQTVTAGIVSAKGRPSFTEQYVPFIQSDVAINRGNSGGPLVNLDGEVIGVNSQILSATGGSIGISFSIPINLSMDIVDQLKNDGVVRRGYLGVGYQEVTHAMAQSFGLERVHGALVNSVQPDSPADNAGIEPGDVVIAVDDAEVRKFNDLPYLIGLKRPGTEVDLTYVRDGKTRKAEVKVASREQFASANPAAQQPAENSSLGVTVGPLTGELTRTFSIESGVMVREIDPTGAAYRAGVRPGDVIQSVNRRTIESVADFNDAIADLPGSGTAALLVTTPGAGSRYLAIDLD